MGGGGNKDLEARGEAGGSPLGGHALGSCTLLCYCVFTGHSLHAAALPSQSSHYRGEAEDDHELTNTS